MVLKKLFFLVFSFSQIFASEFYTKQDIEKMIANMVILGFYGKNIDKNSVIYKEVKAGLGGVILFDKDPRDKNKIKNIQSPEQLKRLNSSLQNISKQKLFISIDQEGGIVQRLSSKNGFFSTLKANQISKKSEAFAKKEYKKLSFMLASNGLNLNFAPVVDLAINNQNSVIVKKGRSFGKSTKDVVKYASIFVDELKNQNVISVLKHFPGHGSSLKDSHKGFVDISNTWSKKELKPYEEFIKNDKAQMIMTAHVFNKNLDEKYPATLSYKVNTQLLRETLGFKGVLISDDLQMYAIAKHYNLEDTLSLAINSGVNILLFANQLAKPIRLKTIVDTVYKLILEEKILLDSIIKSNEKINQLKRRI